MTKPGKNTVEEKEKFEEALVNTFRARMVEYDGFMKTSIAEYATIEASSMGNFSDPETGKEYGFKLVIGRPDFYKEEETPEFEEEEEDEY